MREPSCPTHGTTLIRATTTGFPDLWCWPCSEEERVKLQAFAEEIHLERRARHTMGLLSRFFVWVYMEALARQGAGVSFWDDPGDTARVFSCSVALRGEIVRVEWT